MVTGAIRRAEIVIVNLTLREIGVEYATNIVTGSEWWPRIRGRSACGTGLTYGRDVRTRA